MFGKFPWGAFGRVQRLFSVPGGSQERSWTRLGVDLARHRAPRAKERVLGSILGTIVAPKMMFFVFVPYAVFIVFVVCFPSSCLALFLRYLAVRAKGRKAKFDTPSERKRDLSRCTLAPALPQGRQPMVKKILHFLK